MGDVSADDVRSVLQDVDYPASKEALLDAAFRAGAGSDVLKALRALPVEDYGNVDEVVRSVDTAEATGQSPADKAVRARERAHPELAEHMRDRQAPRLDPDAEE
jgi:hypothetical protein